MQQIGLANQSLSVLWTRCRLVGLINMIYFGVNIITMVLTLASCIFFLFKMKTKAEEEKYSDIYMILLIILILITLIVMIVFFRINYALTSGNPPSSGTRTERWLLFHKVLFCIYIICVIYVAIIELRFIIGGVILLIILAIEIYVVDKFNSEITSTRGIIGIVL